MKFVEHLAEKEGKNEIRCGTLAHILEISKFCKFPKPKKITKLVKYVTIFRETVLLRIQTRPFKFCRSYFGQRFFILILESYFKSKFFYPVHAKIKTGIISIISPFLSKIKKGRSLPGPRDNV